MATITGRRNLRHMPETECRNIVPSSATAILFNNTAVEEVIPIRSTKDHAKLSRYLSRESDSSHRLVDPKLEDVHLKRVIKRESLLLFVSDKCMGCNTTPHHPGCQVMIDRRSRLPECQIDPAVWDDPPRREELNREPDPTSSPPARDLTCHATKRWSTRRRATATT